MQRGERTAEQQGSFVQQNGLVCCRVPCGRRFCITPTGRRGTQTPVLLCQLNRLCTLHPDVGKTVDNRLVDMDVRPVSVCIRAHK